VTAVNEEMEGTTSVTGDGNDEGACVVLCCFALCRFALHCVASRCFVLRRLALPCLALHCLALPCFPCHPLPAFLALPSLPCLTRVKKRVSAATGVSVTGDNGQKRNSGIQAPRLPVTVTMKEPVLCCVAFHCVKGAKKGASAFLNRNLHYW
jgi:hypothetical protein